MIKKQRYIGIISQLAQRKYKDGNPFFIGKIESPFLEDRLDFHQKYLLSKNEIPMLSNRRIVIFEIETIVTEKESKTQVKRCSLNYEKEIEENIGSYSKEVAEFIFRHAPTAFKARLKGNIEINNQPRPNFIVKTRQSVSLNTSESNENKVQETISNSLQLERKPEHAFLWSIFTNNEQEYNFKLLSTLVEGIIQINDDQVYEQVKVLLKINADMKKKGLVDLAFSFYQKASEHYQFLFWLENFVDFCSTSLLAKHFRDADPEMKKEILKRCGGNEQGYLINQLPQVDQEKEVEVLFHGIRAKMLQELDAAKSSIRCAVAWFTNHEIFGMLCKKLEQNVKVELVITNDYINNWEFGLPFQTFIDLGGKLYLSEHPGLMHHKFCIIDNKVLINGSYNWTYYADWFNKENIMVFHETPKLIKKFYEEYEQIKTELGEPIAKLEPFQEHEMKRFERRAYREYLSADLILQADQVKSRNAEYAANLTSSAILLDPENTHAISLKTELIGLVKLEELSELVVKTLEPSQSDDQKQVFPNEETIDVLDLLIDTESRNIEDVHDVALIPQLTTTKMEASEIDDSQKSKDIRMELSNIPTIQTINESRNIQTPPPSTFNDLQIEKARHHSMSSSPQSKSNKYLADIREVIHTPASIKQHEAQLDAYAIPIKVTTTRIFENLQVAIALDTSGSMGELYKNGTVQKVVQRLLGLALTITKTQSLDVWTFDNLQHRQESVTKSNYIDYVIKKGFSGNNGTVASNVIIDISKKFFIESLDGNPVFAIILTDGDVGSIDTLISDSKKHPIFWQFVGLGSKFAALDKLNAGNDNISFFSINNIETISDEELYKKLLGEFPIWFKSQSKNI